MPLSYESYICDPRPHYPLLITAKRYWDAGRPSLSHDEQRRAVTLVCTHGVGLHKEQWEPTIQHLFDSATAVREVWAIDAPNHGDAAVLNEQALQWGYATAFDWQEYARCVHIFLTGQGRGVDVDFTTRRLVGVGHSMGATAIILAGTFSRTTLFETVILVEPMLMPPETVWGSEKMIGVFAAAAERRQDTWSSRQEAVDSLLARKPYASWDPRVIDIYAEHGLRSLPAPGYPDKMDGVALKCQKHWEAASYRTTLGRIRAYTFLHVLCATTPVHFVFGVIIDILPRHIQQHLLDVAAQGRYVSQTMISGSGHMVPQMQPAKLADAISAALQSSSSSALSFSKL